jgi:uncharacterized lipoprotein YehR (DUF1307 family)
MKIKAKTHSTWYTDFGICKIKLLDSNPFVNPEDMTNLGSFELDIHEELLIYFPKKNFLEKTKKSFIVKGKINTLYLLKEQIGYKREREVLYHADKRKKIYRDEYTFDLVGLDGEIRTYKPKKSGRTVYTDYYKFEDRLNKLLVIYDLKYRTIWGGDRVDLDRFLDFMKSEYINLSHDIEKLEYVLEERFRIRYLTLKIDNVEFISVFKRFIEDPEFNEITNYKNYIREKKFKRIFKFD